MLIKKKKLLNNKKNKSVFTEWNYRKVFVIKPHKLSK